MAPLFGRELVISAHVVQRREAVVAAPGEFLDRILCHGELFFDQLQPFNFRLGLGQVAYEAHGQAAHLLFLHHTAPAPEEICKRLRLFRHIHELLLNSDQQAWFKSAFIIRPGATLRAIGAFKARDVYSAVAESAVFIAAMRKYGHVSSRRCEDWVRAIGLYHFPAAFFLAR